MACNIHETDSVLEQNNENEFDVDNNIKIIEKEKKQPGPQSKTNKKKKKAKKSKAENNDDIDEILKELDTSQPIVEKTVKPTEKICTEELTTLENLKVENDEEEIHETKNKKKRQKKKKVGESNAEETENSQSKKNTNSKNKKQSSQGKFLLKRIEAANAESERIERENAETERLREEERQKILEAERIEEEKKQKRRQKERERKQRLKQEGKILPKTQKDRKARDALVVQQLIQSGAAIRNENSVKTSENLKTSNYYRRRKPTKANKDQESQANSELQIDNHSKVVEEPKSNQCSGGNDENQLDKVNEVVSTWEELIVSESASKISNNEESVVNEDVSSNYFSHISDPALRIKTRREFNVKNRNPDSLRSPIICVMGHVDTGKTKMLDKLRHTHVQDGEAGGITQQIGVTNVPLYAIRESVSMCKYMDNFNYEVPGILLIDTPGHESFRNLRSLGSSLCDVAILIVDSMHGLEPQTIESIKLLKEKKTPFVVAFNKIDLIVEWTSMPKIGIQEMLQKQNQRTQTHFDDLFKRIFVQFAEQEMNVALFYDNPDPSMYVSVIPTSAHSGDGIGDLISYICKYSQTNLRERLIKCLELQATVMEVKMINGLGPSVDVILVNGSLKKGDKIILAGLDGPIVTQIRSLLTPHPMKEMRVKNDYLHHDSISISQGIKIAGPNLEKTIPGVPIFSAEFDDEIEIYKEEIAFFINKSLSSFKKSDKGVYVQASTLGSLEALLSFLRNSKIPYFGMNIGPVHRRDVMSSSAMLEVNPFYSVILAFDVKIDPDAQSLADKMGVKIFNADIIYHLFDQFTEYTQAYKKKKAEEFRSLAVFPCVLRILPEHIYMSRDPIIVGVVVDEGVARIGTPLCVPSKENLVIGYIASIEQNHKIVDKASTGQEVCVKIVQLGEEAPKMYSRHFTHEDPLVSKITRESIDVLKEYFRDDVTKPEWNLIIKLKKTFKIL